MDSIKRQTGLVFYCLAHDQGCLIKNIYKDSDLPETINDKMCSGSHNCDWECVGKFKIVEDKPILDIMYYFKNLMETDFWPEENWEKVIYDIKDF